MTNGKNGRDTAGRFVSGNPGKPAGARQKSTFAAQALLDGEAETLTDSFWEEITPEDLERVRRALRELVKLIELIERKIVYTDFTDEIDAGTEVAIDAIAPGMDKLRFTMKVRRFLERHKDHIALLKLRRAEQLTKTDIAELEKMFLDDCVPVDDTVPEITTVGGLGLFLRSLIGLDRKAAKQAFSALTDGRTLNSNQTEFLDLVNNHLTARGVIDPARFYESPFTDLSAQACPAWFPKQTCRRSSQSCRTYG